MQKLTNQIANNADINLGAYVPPELKKGLPMRASLDNIDRKVDTVDGKKSFHGTAITLYISDQCQIQMQICILLRKCTLAKKVPNL